MWGDVFAIPDGCGAVMVVTFYAPAIGVGKYEYRLAIIVEEGITEPRFEVHRRIPPSVFWHSSWESA